MIDLRDVFGTGRRRGPNCDGMNAQEFSMGQWAEMFHNPKDPDPSKLAILRTQPLLYRFFHPSIGGSNDP